MSVSRRYLKNPRLSALDDWVERELEAIEQVMASEVTGLRWDDLRFPSQGINPAGSVEPPDVNTTDGLLDFAHNKDCIITGVAQMPHRWEDGTEIRPHLHLQFRNAAAGNTRWKLEYDIASVNNDFAGSYTSETVTLASPTSVVKHCIISFSPISMTGYRDSCIIKWRITRPGATDSADTHDYAVGLLEFDIHYLAGSHGSVSEIPS